MGRGAKTTKTTNQSSSRTGLEAAQPALLQLLSQLEGSIGSAGITPAETSALSGLQASAGAGTEFTPQVSGLISNLFEGGGFGEGRDLIRSNAGLLQEALTPVARGDFTDPTQDPILNAALTRAQDAAVTRARSPFIAGGRSFSPSESRAVGEGVADVTSRALLSERARQEGRQFGALDRLISGGISSAGALDAGTANELNARRGAVGLIPSLTALEQQPDRTALEIEALRRNTELGELGLLSNILLPISASGGTATGTSTTTQQRRADPLQTLLSAGLGTAGLLSGAGVFGPALGAAGGAGGVFGNIGLSQVPGGGLPALNLFGGR